MVLSDRKMTMQNIFAMFLQERNSLLLVAIKDSKTSQWEAFRIGFNELSSIRTTGRHVIFQLNILPAACPIVRE